MAGNEVKLDFDEWNQHAQWWDQEAARVRQQLSVDPGMAESVGQRFGDIGWEVRQALNETLQARSEAGRSLGQYCESVAGHIRSNISSYQQTEEASQQILQT
ncbi:type VII secretion target [Mycobacterium riyadhense]|uniref:type VII secretion target n=1 Tax=Mycobacterium riyadhense TaxID=486698 RepID=UPI00195940CF|nr:type VII secretion target [Mycobacterium riyadhense]